MGGRSIACLNARDRNLLGFRRDLLTAAAYGVDQFLLVYGDQPVSGARTGELTVRSMLDELRTFSARPEAGHPRFRAGVTARLTTLPAWKTEADFLMVQVGFDLGALFRWRDTVAFDGPIYPGVIVLASPAMATKLSEQVTAIRVPHDVVARVEADRGAGVELAAEQLDAIRDHGGFAGRTSSRSVATATSRRASNDLPISRKPDRAGLALVPVVSCLAVTAPAAGPRRFARHGDATPYTPAIRILVLCTANVCRSPMAEAFLDRELEDRGVDAEVSSAGRLSGGRWTTPENIDVMARHGVDLAGHRSTQASPAMVRGADLILGMAREHVRDATALAPDVFARCFTLKELVRRGDAVGPRVATETLDQWLEPVGAGRHPSDLVGPSPADDIADPIGGPEARYEAVAAEIAALTHRLVDLAWPPDEGSGSSTPSQEASAPLAWTDTD